MKNDLVRLKAGLLAVAMCFSLSSCASSDEKVDNDEETMLEQTVDTKSYLITFIEGKAVIYEGEGFTYSKVDGYAAIYEDITSMKFLQTPCIVLTGKENCINFASSIVGEENIVFMNITDGKNLELVLSPNN